VRLIQAAFFGAILAVAAGCSGPASSPSISPPAATPDPNATPTPRPSAPDIAAQKPGDRLLATVKAGRQPCAIAADDHDRAWVTNYGAASLVSIDGESSEVSEPTETRLNPCAIVWSAGALWVAQLGSGNVARVDPDTGETIFTLPVNGQVWDMQVSEDGAVWIAVRNSRTVLRVDPATNVVVAAIQLEGTLSGMAVTPGAVWVAVDSENQAVRIDSATNEIAATIPLDGSPTWWGTDGEHLWLSFMDDGTVAPVDPATNTVGDPVYVGGHPLDLAVAAGKAWVPDIDSGTLWELDATSGEIKAGYELAPGIFVAEERLGDLWVLNFGGEDVYRLSLD
jgi:streptogramin lyase